MPRIAFTLVVPAENLPEYRRRHDALWPDMRDQIARDGIRNYSIFAAPEFDRVFAYLDVDDLEVWRSGALNEVTQRWWKYMSDIMPSNDDGSPVQTMLEQVFYQP